jgi:hypothetical protein
MPKHFSCPCCRFLTLPEPSPGSWEICPVCFWQDDPVGAAHPMLRHGPNPMSLDAARRNFAAFGACESRMLPHVRRPLPNERP